MRVISAFLLVLLTWSSVAAEQFAPLVDISTVSSAYLKNKVKFAKVPPAKEVPVQAFSPAKVFSILKVARSGKGMFQETRIIFLATESDPQTVTDFYRTKLSGWKTKPLKSGMSFYEKGEKFFLGRKDLLEGPRVDVIDLSKTERVGSVEIKKLMESFPEMKTVFKIHYVKETSKQLAINVDDVVAKCVKHEIDSKGKMFGKNKKGAPASYLKKMAESSCKKVRKSCTKDTKGRFCQKYARQYN